MKIIKNEEINENLFSQMIRLDHAVWPSDDESYLPASYLRRLYEGSKDGLFFAVDDEGHLMGYQTLIFVDEDNFQKYYETGDFTILKNIGMKKGNNILYIYTANIKEEYQGSGCMKKIGKAIASWLVDQEEKGYRVSVAYAEAVTSAGVKTVTGGYEMEPMEDVDETGLGHYILKDGMKAYCKKMLEESD